MVSCEMCSVQQANERRETDVSLEILSETGVGSEVPLTSELSKPPSVENTSVVEMTKCGKYERCRNDQQRSDRV